MLRSGVMQDTAGTVVVVIVEIVTVDVTRMLKHDAGVVVMRRLLLLWRLKYILLLVQMMRPSALLLVRLLVTRS